MKQKLLTLKALLMVLMMTLGFGQAFAEEVFYTLTTTQSSTNTAYASTYDVTINELIWNAPGNQNFSGYWRIGGKSLTNVDRTITGKSKMGSAISKVTLNHKGISNANLTVNSISLLVSSSSDFAESDIIETITKNPTFVASTAGSVDFEPTKNNWAKDSYYKIVINVSNSRTSNYGLDLTSIVFYKGDEGGSTKTSTTTTFNGESSYSVELGQTFNAPTATVKAGETTVTTPAVTYSSSETEVATVNAETGAVTLVGAGTTTITAAYAGDDTYAASSASYTLTVTKPVPVFASLEDLVADETLNSGDIVTVTINNEIKDIFVTAKGYRNGIYFDIQKAGKDIELYFQNVPTEWVIGGTVSGTVTAPWKDFNGTWELAPTSEWAWSNLTYTAPAGKETATIEATAAKAALTVGTNDVYDVTYNGDGVLSVESSNPSAATVTIEGTTVTVTPVGAGTTTITISAPATENYTAATKSYSVTVTKPATPATLPFSFDGGFTDIDNTDGMSQNGLGSDYSASPKLRFDDTNDELVINYAESANRLSYTIKGNSFSGGTFDVLESADGEDYTLVRSHTAPKTTAENITDNLKAESRFVKFVYTNKSKGNVALGNIKICTSVEANLQITDAGVATFCAPFDVDLNKVEGIDATAYTATVEDGWVKLAEIESGVIKAGTAVVLKGAEMTEAKTLTGVPATTEATCTTGCLTGNLSAVTSVAIGNFLLQKQEEAGLAWYKVTEEGLKIGTNRCYLTKEAVTGARTVLNMDLNPTGIDSIATEAKTKADGKYLVNGKIVVVKAGKVYDLK